MHNYGRSSQKTRRLHTRSFVHRFTPASTNIMESWLPVWSTCMRHYNLSSTSSIIVDFKLLSPQMTHLTYKFHPLYAILVSHWKDSHCIFEYNRAPLYLVRCYWCRSEQFWKTFTIPTSAQHQSHFSPTSVPLQPNISPTSAQHQSHFSPTSVPLQPNISPTSAQHQSHFRPTSVPLQTNISPTSDQHQSHFRPTSVPLQTNISPTSDQHQSHFSPTSVPLQTNIIPILNALPNTIITARSAKTLCNRAIN